MARIVISHDKKYGNKWCPFKERREILGKDMDRIVKDAWDKLKHTDIYDQVKGDVDDLSCECDYASEPRPMDPRLFEDYRGCVFDLDGYCSDVDYIRTEIDNLPSGILAGAISNQMKNFTLKPGLENLYELPINDENGVRLYLKTLLYLMKEDLAKKKLRHEVSDVI